MGEIPGHILLQLVVRTRLSPAWYSLQNLLPEKWRLSMLINNCLTFHRKQSICKDDKR